MTTEVAVNEQKTLFGIVDDLQAYTETLEMLDAQLAEPLPDEERAEIEGQRREVMASVEHIGKELATKTDAIAVVLRRIGFERDYIKQERTRLKIKEAASERAEKWLRQYVISVMQQNGMKQLKTATNTLFIRGSEAVEVTDPTVLDPEYLIAEVKLPLALWHSIAGMVASFGPLGMKHDVDVLRVHEEPSLSTIKKAIKAGVDVAGADLKFNNSLVCK